MFRIAMCFFLMAVGLVVAMTPGIYCLIYYPELTRNQIFREYWMYMIGGIVLMCTSGFMVTGFKGTEK